MCRAHAENVPECCRIKITLKKHQKDARVSYLISNFALSKFFCRNCNLEVDFSGITKIRTIFYSLRTDKIIRYQGYLLLITLTIKVKNAKQDLSTTLLLYV